MGGPFVFINEHYIPSDEAALRVGDLAIQRGYGIFDFFKTLGGRPIFLEEHLDRFFGSAAWLRLDPGMTQEQLKVVIAELMQKNAIPDSGIRLTLTGGYSADGYTLGNEGNAGLGKMGESGKMNGTRKMGELEKKNDAEGRPNLVITQQPLAAAVTPDLSKPIRLVSYGHQRQMPEIKTIDYLMAIWLQPYLKERDADDLLYHRDGIVTECPRSNFFIVTAEGVLVTPGKHVLKGITRMKLLELARTQYRVEERDVTLEEVYSAKEAFITSTTKHVLPVSAVDGRTVGTGSPGEVSRSLQQRLFELVS